MNRIPIIVTNNAWKKIGYILNSTKKPAFLFSADGGGCNGFNYNLRAIDNQELDSFTNQRIKPTMFENSGRKLVIDPLSEMLLLGTTVDYIKEDFSNQIFESKFTFKPQKDLASTCGCGTSFSMK